MTKRARLPIALSIAGSDSGGGAGIQADLKTFAALHVHGTTALTSLTAQNPREVLAVEPVSARMVERQLQAISNELPPAAAKTGMLYSEEIIRVISNFMRRRHMQYPLIVDPVMVSTSGARLLAANACSALVKQLFPLATLVTPNLDEAELLLEMKIHDEEGLRQAAREIVRRFGCAALVKGGHLAGRRQATDIFNDGREELLLLAPYIRDVSTHGTGCTYSAAIAAYCARGESLPSAVGKAKQYITQAIARSAIIAQHRTLGT